MIARALMLASLLLLGSCSGPDFHDMDGATVRLDQFGGRWIVINYWAIWCRPCREEIPELNELARSGSARVALLGVNFDLPPVALLREQAESLGIEFPVLVEDPAATLGYARPEVLPTTILVDQDGDFAIALEGPQSAESILKAIEQL